MRPCARSPSASDAPADEALALLVREALTGAAAAGKGAPICDAWRPMIAQRPVTWWGLDPARSRTRSAFGRILRDMLVALDLAEDPVA